MVYAYCQLTLFLEYEYISESETDLSDNCFTSECTYENTRPNGNATRRSDAIRKQHETTESTSLFGGETESSHQATNGEDTKKSEKDTKMSPTPSSCKQIKENIDAIGVDIIGCHNDGMHISGCVTTRPQADEHQNVSLKIPKSGLQKTKETSHSDNKTAPDMKTIEHDLPQETQEQIPKSKHVIHLKKYMNFKKKTLEYTEHDYNAMAKKIDEDQGRANNVVYDDEQNSPPKHFQTPDADNLSHKYVCTDRGADGQSKRNSYERLNMDTMEPRDKVCQCKAHPGRAKSRHYSTTWKDQTKMSPYTCPQTSAMNPYIESLCQRTAEIMLHKLSSKLETNEMVRISKIDRHIGGKDDLDTKVDGFVQPDGINSLSNVATGGFDEEDLQSNKEMKPVGWSSIPHDSRYHLSQYFDFCGTSFCNIPLHAQSDVKQDAAQNEEEVEGAFRE